MMWCVVMIRIGCIAHPVQSVSEIKNAEKLLEGAEFNGMISPCFSDVDGFFEGYLRRIRTRSHCVASSNPKRE